MRTVISGGAIKCQLCKKRLTNVNTMNCKRHFINKRTYRQLTIGT